MGVARAEGVLDDVVDGRAVLIGSAGTHVVELNAVGSLVWNGLDGKRDVADLVELVRSALDDQDTVPAAQIETDVVTFLDKLKKLDLVRP